MLISKKATEKKQTTSGMLSTSLPLTSGKKSRKSCWTRHAIRIVVPVSPHLYALVHPFVQSFEGRLGVGKKTLGDIEIHRIVIDDDIEFHPAACVVCSVDQEGIIIEPGR